MCTFCFSFFFLSFIFLLFLCFVVFSFCFMCCIFRPLASTFLIVLLHLMNVPSCHRCPVPGTTLPPTLYDLYVNKTRFRLALRFRWRQRPTACLFLCMFLYLSAPTPLLFAISPSLFRLIYESLNVASRVASRRVASPENQNLPLGESLDCNWLRL